MIEKITSFFSKPKEETEGQAPEGICPVCWGYQQYDHKIRKLHEDMQVDVNNRKASYTLIRDFMVNHLDGIRLKEGEIESCPSCTSEN